MRPPRPFALAAHARPVVALLARQDRDRRCERRRRARPERTPGTSLTPGTPADAAGLAFDHECRLYRSIPDGGPGRAPALGGDDPLGPRDAEATPLDLLQGPPRPAGDFLPPLRRLRRRSGRRAASPSTATTGCSSPRPARGAILVYDLWNRQLLRRTGSCAAPTRRPPARPRRARGHRVVRARERPNRAARRSLSACRRSSCVGRPDLPADAEPRRLAVSPGGLLVGAVHRRRRSRVAAAAKRRHSVPAGRAARPTWSVAGDGSRRRRARAGRRLPLLPDRRNARDRRRAAEGAGLRRLGDRPDARRQDRLLDRPRPARGGRRPLAFETEGRVTTYRLDSGEYHTEWGRLFVDACIPAGCDLRVIFATADDVADEPTIAHNAATEPRRADLASRSVAADAARSRSHRRRTTPVCRSTGARPDASCRGRASTRTTPSRPTRRPCSLRRAATSG